MRWLSLALVGVVSLGGCRKATQPPIIGDAVADSAEQVIYDGWFLLTNSGVKRGELQADTMYVFNDQSRFLLRHIRGKFNTETGAPNGTVKGDRGTYDLRTKILEGFGNVEILSTDGRRLRSNHLKYSQFQDQFSSDSAYTLVRGTETQRGIGFVSDPNLTTFRCLRACGGEALVPLSTLPKP